MTLDERLDNWARCWRSHSPAAIEEVNHNGRLERRRALRARPDAYRSRGSVHWDSSTDTSARGVMIGIAPRALVPLDHTDAAIVEHAVCALDIYHHVILKGVYVREWPSGRILHVAREAAGEPGRRGRTGNLESSLRMAQALLTGLLLRPAVLRRERAAARAARMLGLAA